MLLILIPIGWLAIVAFFVVLCQAAARGDAAMLATARPPRVPARARMTVFEGTHAGAARDRGGMPLAAATGLTMRTHAPKRGAGARRLRCVR
jgi:hypothetical protein